MKLTLGFSPCPNDTFIFDALVNNKIDTAGFEFDVVLEDVQTLNNWAKDEKLDVTKINFGVLPLIVENYIMLNSGSALGKGVGPLLVSKQKFNLQHLNVENLKVAIPGENTTAHMLFKMAFPDVKDKMFLVFSQIEDAVLTGKADAGVIIHENRFTYHDKGLLKLLDLGEYWEQKMNLPIPLGGIAIRRSLDKKIQLQVNELIQNSLKYAFNEYPQLSNYVKENAQEMDEVVMRKHINLYVNDFSIDLKAEGQSAVMELLDHFKARKEDVFVI